MYPRPPTKITISKADVAQFEEIHRSQTVNKGASQFKKAFETPSFTSTPSFYGQFGNNKKR